MPLSSVMDLEDFLLEQRLVESLQLQECRRQLGPQLDFERLLKTLEQRSFLTSYQTQKLLKRETDGLRVGPYKLLYRNASGSFARVFRGCSVDDGRMIAIKLLRQRFAEDPHAVTMFRREGELGKRLKHKNIVPIYEVGHDNGQHYIAMEFVEGGNFRDFIKIRKKFSVQDSTQYVLDIAEGLEYALGLGLTHRDLKLSNVLLSAQGVAKLVDFGLAGQDSATDDVDRAIEYATLEKNTRAPDNDPRSDLYFLGAIYFELLTGVPPYQPTKSRDERRQFSRYRDVLSVRSLDPNIPAEVEAIVERLMQIEPDQRYQTPTEAAIDLRKVLGAPPSSASASASAPSAPAAAPALPTVICVENRTKPQDALREYFSKHGFRVLVLSDPIRALNRIDTEAVAGLVLIGDALGAETQSVYQAAVSRCKRRRVPIVLALSPKAGDLKDKLATTDYSRILSEGVTLRRIRESLGELQAALS